MKRTAFFCLVALTSISLFGCQVENEAAQAEEEMSESEATESEALLIEGDIAIVELSETKGIDPVIYKDANDLGIFHDLFSSAIRQPGIVNIIDPEFYLKVVMADGDEHYLHLWLGSEGETASLMDADDTHTLYSVTPDVDAKLIELVKE